MTGQPCARPDCGRPLDDHRGWALGHLHRWVPSDGAARPRLLADEDPVPLDAPVIPVRRQNSDGSYGIEMITPTEWERRRPRDMDE